MESALVDVSWQQKSRHRWTKWKMLRSTCPSDRRARISDRAWWEQQDGRSKHAPKSQMFPFYPQQKKSVDIWRWYRGMTALAIAHTTNNEPSKAGAYDAPKKGEAQAGLTKLFQLIAARNGWSLLPFTWAKFMEPNMINEAIGGNLCDFVCSLHLLCLCYGRRAEVLDWPAGLTSNGSKSSATIFWSGVCHKVISQKFWDFWPPTPFICIKRNLSVLFVRKIWQFFNHSVRTYLMEAPSQ